MKNEPVRLQSAEKLFERIAEQKWARVELHPDYMPRRLGWTPAPDYRVVAKADVYKGRDYEALTKAALKPPVGYWEDAPRGEPFTGVGNGSCPKRDATASKQGVAPLAPTLSSSSDDPYEPVGTVPIVGDNCVCEGFRFRVVGVGDVTCRGDSWSCDMECFREGGNMVGATARILKRQKAPQAPAPQGLKVRAWKNPCIQGRVFAHGKMFNVHLNWYSYSYMTVTDMEGLAKQGQDHAELPAQEALELWRSCATALKLNVETGEPL